MRGQTAIVVRIDRATKKPAVAKSRQIVAIVHRLVSSRFASIEFRRGLVMVWHELRVVTLYDDVMAQGQYIDIGFGKTIERLLGTFDDRFAANIEARIHEDRAMGSLIKCGKQCIQGGMSLRIDGLNSCGQVHVRNCWNFGAFLA